MFKRKRRSRYHDEPSPIRRFLIALGVVAFIAVVLVGFTFLGRLGPRNVDYSELKGKVEIPVEVQALLEESLKLEADFDEMHAVRDTDEVVEILKSALVKMEEYVEALPMGNPDASARVRELRKRYQDLVSRSIQQESLAHEKAAIAYEDNSDLESARLEYGKALDKQRQINEDYPLSIAYNIGRATLLERQIRHLMAEPLLQQSLAFEKEALELIEARDWAAAQNKLQKAIAHQDQLNREFRGSNQASVARVETLRTQLLGIRSGQSYVEVEEVLAEADRRQANGENLEAARLYQEATRLQRQLNESFRGSPYASSERVEEFQRKADTAESYELGLRIESNHNRLDRLLAERRTHQATELIALMRGDIKQMQEAFPRSSLNDEDLELKVRYLNLIQNDLGFIQDRVYDALLPIPENEDWKILRTEVSQALYTLIMGTNPSRMSGDVNPVDSVSWTDAKSFCERLTWIMGKSVRLPTENEFRKTLGPLRYVVLEDHVWSISNSEGQVQPAGRKDPFSSGAFDLLGNVSEWLESQNRFGSEDAQHIGGHAQDNLEVIFTVPLRTSERSERNRMTGFRFVVQTK